MTTSPNPHGPTPLKVASASEVAWDDEADVVVVGFGGAGAAAAVEAREHGVDVLAIDRFGGGGATHYSGGVLYAGGGTRHQRDAGFDDTPDEMFNYLSAEGSAVGPDTLRRFCENSVGDVEWLEAHGVPYGSNAYLKKTAYPPDPHYLYYSGNEMIPAFQEKARPAPRGHRPVTASFGGHLHYARLRAAAVEQGVRVLTHAPARRLIVDLDDRVIGVEVNAMPETLHARHQELNEIVSPWKPLNAASAQQAIDDCLRLEASVEAPRYIRARGGVILSTGGFVNNLSMLGRHRKVLAENYLGIQRLGSMGCDGSGIALGQSVGGATALMDRMFLGRSITPPDAFVYGLIVNAAGERIINEDAYNAIVGNKIAEQPEGGKAYLVMDGEHFWRGVWQSLFPGKNMFMMWGAPALLNIVMGGTRRAGSLRRLAQKCGISAAGLERTVTGFNAMAAAGTPDPFGRAPDKMKPLAGRSWFAVNVSLANKYAPTWAFTLGGLVLNEETGAVARADGSTVPGLYAAGRTAVGLCSQGYMSGLAIADTVFSGRRAARSAARDVNERVA